MRSRASSARRSALALTLDVRDQAAVARAIAELPPELAAIDLLVNNAGLARGLEPAQRASLDDWNEMVDTNVKGLMAMTRAVLPGMVARDRGHVVNIGSTAGRWPYPGGNVYGATKAFVDQFSLNLRADLLGTKVRVTVIDPGMVGGTEFSNVRFHGDDARAAQGLRGHRAARPRRHRRGGPLGHHAARPRQHQHHRAHAGRQAYAGLSVSRT